MPAVLLPQPPSSFTPDRTTASVMPIRRILAVTAAAYGLDPAVDHRHRRSRPVGRGEAANKSSARRSA